MSGTGLAFSGGGIRSAALCSGVLRRLLQRGVEPDYLSCVSGGGYTGTAYLDWKFRHEQKDDPSWHKRFFEHMRRRAGVICDWQRPLIGFLDMLVLLSLMCFVSIFVPVVIWGSYAAPLAFSINYVFGNLLRAKDYVCPTDAPIPASVNESLSQARIECKIPTSSPEFHLMLLFIISAMVFFFSCMASKMTTSLRGVVSLISSTSGLILAFTLFPYLVYNFLDQTPRWTQLLAVFGTALMWFFVPVLRQKSSFVLIVYAFSYLVYWHVYKLPVLGVEYSERGFFVAMFVSGVVLWVVPIFGALQQRLVHIYNRSVAAYTIFFILVYVVFFLA